MKSWWDAQASRINGLSLRERVFSFLSVIAICAALVDAVWLSPTQQAHQQLTQRLNKQSVELQRARNELQAIAKPADAHQAVRDEIAAVQINLDTANQTIKNAMSVGTKDTPLAQVLTHLLRRHEGLTLLRTATMAPETPAGKTALQPGTGGTAPPGGLTRQGVEMSVSGPYPELMRFVQTLEDALPQVRWGSMKLKSETSPPELTLQLFLVGT